MKLKVENLAKIRQAEVEVKNLTLFVGQNSTNKSYMAHIIYELFKEISSLGGRKRNWNKQNQIQSSIVNQLSSNYSEYFKSIKKSYSEEIEEEQIDYDEFEKQIWTIVSCQIDDIEYLTKILQDINQLVLNELVKLINNSFNTKINILEKLLIETEVIPEKVIKIYCDTPLEYFSEEEENIPLRIMHSLINTSINKLYNILNDYDNSYYFPASRTGFVLTQEEIYAGIFRDKFRGQASATKLGEPTIDFIQKFADIKMNNIRNIRRKKSLSKIQKLINFLENNIIKGSIKENTTEQGYTNYYLSVKNTKIDLHMASSATLETLPFIVFLNNTQDIKKTFFVIEEPEAHLHPKAQIQMAKFIVMLSNAGAKVLVTTHSDYILGEINNCIKKYELKIQSDDTISKENISAYLFKNDKNETEVKELQIDKFGITNENFDEALDELLEESGQLTDKILEDEK